MSYVLKVDRERIEKLRQTLLQSKLVTELAPTNPYEVFRVKCGTDTIVAYTSGKIVATGTESKRVLSNALLSLPQTEALPIVVGSDEAGKGEWLGPMVAAAVALDQKTSVALAAEGIMDSKLLSLTRIRELTSIVKKHSLGFKVVTVPPVRFNELVAEVKDERKSLNDLLAWAHAIAIKEVIKKIQNIKEPVKIVIDEFDKLKMKRRLERVVDLRRYHLSQYPKAEREIAVAAASILAREEREYWIDMESKRRGMDLRALRVDEALRRDDSFLFAKVSYLKLGSSEQDLIFSRFLQDAIVLEHLLEKTARLFGTKVEHESVKSLLDELRTKGLLTENLLYQIAEVFDIHNRLIHGEIVSDKELGAVTDVSAYLIDSLREIVRGMEKEKREPQFYPIKRHK